ncbi:MAG: DUF4864 domain-containing protein [Myxococcaceae bacterium]
MTGIQEREREGSALELTPTDRIRIRDVIREQLDALRAHDPVRALACATPQRRNHGTPGLFMETIARAFPQLVHSKRVEFGEVRRMAGFVAQPVRVTASDGSTTHAVYLMIRQDDGVWLIDGCVCAPTPGGSLEMQFPN